MRPERESPGPPGAKGYAEDASSLIERYDAIGFAQKHQALLSLIPPKCSRALDIGAGAGGDAAWLASKGYDVVAVEPTAEFRTYACQRHTSPRIEWMDDCLPDLAQVTSRMETFDLVIISAVWMHLEASERSTAMPILASLLSPAGVLYISLRHGPIPDGRMMFEVSPSETVACANASRLHPVLNLSRPSIQMANREARVTWSQLAFVKDGEDGA